MEKIRFSMLLDSNEAALVVETAKVELREPREQARLLIREALHARGLLPREPKGPGSETREASYAAAS